MDKRDFAIGILSTTAVVLFVGLLIVQSQPPPVRADGMTVMGGGYVMTVGKSAPTDEELVYIIHAGTDRMLSYRLDTTSRTIQRVQGIDLSEVRRSTERHQPPSAGKSSTPPPQPVNTP